VLPGIEPPEQTPKIKPEVLTHLLLPAQSESNEHAKLREKQINNKTVANPIAIDITFIFSSRIKSSPFWGAAFKFDCLSLITAPLWLYSA